MQKLGTLGFCHTGMFAWERTRTPKPMDSVRITAFLLNCRCGSTEKGTCLVNRLMLVQIQSSALAAGQCTPNTDMKCE